MSEQKASTQVAFPRESTRRFHMKLQVSRAGMYLLGAILGFSARWVGVVTFDILHLSTTISLGFLSTFLFFLLYRNRFEEKFKVWLYPYWAMVDVVVISVALWGSGDPGTPFFLLYLLSAGAAAFIQGGRAALVMGCVDIAAYTLVLIYMDIPMGIAQRLEEGLLSLLLMFGIAAYFLRGVALLRHKRLEVLALVEEKSLHMIDLEARSLELETANRRVELANQAKTKFLANMSHELRTPLNSIIGFSDFLVPRVKDRLEDKEVKFLSNIHVSGKHLLGLINDILDLSKVEAGQMEVHLEEVDLNEVMEGVVAVMGGVAMKREINLEVYIAKDILPILSDGPRVKQILYNLVSNAVKFSKDGSPVHIRVHRVEAPAGGIGVRGVAIEVQDSGIGIDEDDQERIFDEFQQVDDGISRNFDGTGLGLALVRRFCELLGGRIGIRSVVGRGSTFTVTLPLDAAIAKELVRGLPSIR